MHIVSYLLIRFLTYPLSLLPYRALHTLGKPLGTLAYYLIPKFRKRALSNLALAPDLALSNNEIRNLAKKSLQSLIITCLEYPKLAREKNISKIATCVNPKIANKLMAEGRGVIFFCGHQANWELLFLEGTSRMPGVAVGRPVKNRHLYNWVKTMRQKFGGIIIEPKQAIKEGLRALKQGKFLGIVGDQGMPGSGYSSPFLGRKAWTSPMPAMLSVKTGAPIIVATTIRKDGKYFIHYSDPLFPNPDAPREEEIQRLMDSALDLFQISIKKHPDQWLWIHNRWKQQTLDAIRRPYRHDSLALFLPNDETLIQKIPLFRKLYPHEQITLFVPQKYLDKISIDAEIHPYTHPKELFQDHYRFKLLFDFTKTPGLASHYKKRSAVSILQLDTIDETLEKEIRGA